MIRLGPGRVAATLAAVSGTLLLLAAVLPPGAAALGLDPPGRLLCALAGGGILAVALLIGRAPVLRADATGLVVLDGWRRVRLDWAEVSALRLDRRRRSRSLEIDAGDRLIVVPAFLLGTTDPARILRELAELRAGSAPPAQGGTGALSSPDTR